MCIAIVIASGLTPIQKAQIFSHVMSRRRDKRPMLLEAGRWVGRTCIEVEVQVVHSHVSHFLGFIKEDTPIISWMVNISWKIHL